MTDAVLFRVEQVQYASFSFNEFGENYGPGRIDVETREFVIAGYTPQGAHIYCYGRKKFVNLRAKKQYACASKSEALEAFKCRKARHIEILRTQLENAMHALDIANNRVLIFV